MRMLEYGHESIVDQVANSIVRSATSHSVGALMRGHGLIAILVISAALICGAWLLKRVF